jgi:hypothetical protein
MNDHQRLDGNSDRTSSKTKIEPEDAGADVKDISFYGTSFSVPGESPKDRTRTSAKP